VTQAATDVLPCFAFIFLSARVAPQRAAVKDIAPIKHIPVHLETNLSSHALASIEWAGQHVMWEEPASLTLKKASQKVRRVGELLVNTKYRAPKTLGIGHC